MLAAWVGAPQKCRAVIHIYPGKWYMQKYELFYTYVTKFKLLKNRTMKDSKSLDIISLFKR